MNDSICEISFEKFEPKLETVKKYQHKINLLREYQGITLINDRIGNSQKY